MLDSGVGVGFFGRERCDGRSELKNAGLETGMAGGIGVLWDQTLLTGGTSTYPGWVRSQVMVSSTPCWRVILGLPSTS